MSELISKAPLYTKDRVHFTKIGNILCTGKGCIGCDRKSQIQADQDLLEILGEVDSVDFDKQEPRFLSNSDLVPCRRPKSLGRHSNDTSLTRTVERNNNTKTGKFRKRRKLDAKPKSTTLADYKSDPALPKKYTINSCSTNYNETVSKQHCGGNMKAEAKPNLRTKDLKSKTVSFAAPLTRERIFTLQPGSKSYKSRRNVITEESYELQFSQCAADKQPRIHDRLRTYPAITKRNTNFLKMLQTSDIGIFDDELMKSKQSSKWVTEALKYGAKEEDIFPCILKKKQERSLREHLRNEGRKQRKRRKENNSSESVRALTRVVPNDRSDIGPSNGAILVVEHSYERLIAKDDSLHKLGFKAQHSQRLNGFPSVSILEIAESLEDLVQLGVVKLIHEREGRWYILVSTRSIRDFLIQNGITLRGRNFELIDCIGTI
ncbi:uncharacterized protein [Montipora foliosa]|uniref:uncharacterized protein n=1 Tax=Montipora foliosa TaxID=591990 RepID=UPI0035F1AF5D